MKRLIQKPSLLLCVLLLTQHSDGCSPEPEFLLPFDRLNVPVRRTERTATETALKTEPRAGIQRVMLELRTQVDLDRLASLLREQNRPKSDRRRIVIDALRLVAGQTQGALRPQLEKLHSEGLLQDWQGFSIVNRLAVSLTGEALAELARHPEVARIVPELENQQGRWLGRPAATAERESRSWGIDAIEAGAAWERGLDGSGIRVGIIDSGASARHEQLAANFLAGGWLAPGQESEVPVDGVLGHGSGVLSCAVGQNLSGIVLGVAPQARWAACAGLPEGRYNNIRVTACADWMLTQVQPDILINAWELPGPGCDDSVAAIVRAWRMAEILPVFAAGNEGPAAATGRSPANYSVSQMGAQGVLSVGGVGRDLTILPESSRGPTSCGGSVFPSIVAPASDVIAALPITLSGYIQAEGTSFAAGFAAGAAALLQQSHPEALARHLEDALLAGASDLGPPGPDNTYGHGLLNVPQALEALDRIMEEE